MRSSQQSTPARTDTRYAWGVCGFLLLAIGLIYGQTLGIQLLDYDDNVFVYENPHVTAGLTGEESAGRSPRARSASGIRWPCCRTCSIASSSACTPGGII